MKDKRIIVIVILVIILSVILYFFFNANSKSDIKNNAFTKNQKEQSEELSKNTETETQTLKSTSEITAATVENIELHATYYLSEIYVEENQYVEEGTNLVKYTNGEYLVAPYDCCITELNLPEVGGQILNSHYIQTQSTNVLSVEINVDESIVNNIEVGNEAEISVTAVENTYTGYVTHVSSTAQNGKFTVNIEFENDSKVKIGMTGTVQIKY